MFWTSYLLAMDRVEQARIGAEVAAFPPDRVASPDDLRNWPRLRNALLEAPRLYPLPPHIQRDAEGPDEIGGEPIRRDAQVWISPWVMHRRRKFWDRPTAFLPDRFACESAPWTRMPAFIPFGMGPRIRIGLAFALSEAQIVLARLFSRYEIGLVDAWPVLPIGRVTTEPSHEPMFALERREIRRPA
jgi:cytochrome P450